MSVTIVRESRRAPRSILDFRLFHQLDTGDAGVLGQGDNLASLMRCTVGLGWPLRLTSTAISGSSVA